VRYCIRVFSFLQNALCSSWPTQPPVQWVSGLEADHSPPSSAEINSEWICTSTPPYMPSCGLYRDNLAVSIYCQDSYGDKSERHPVLSFCSAHAFKAKRDFLSSLPDTRDLFCFQL